MVQEEDFGGFLNYLFEALSHQYRRFVLYYFIEEDAEVADLDELVAYVAALDENVSEPSETERERLRTELDVIHLPRLAEVGPIEYDRRSRSVRYDCLPSVEEWAEHAMYRELEELR
jgi:hypothetical protein